MISKTTTIVLMRITIIKSLKTNKNTKLVTFDYHDIYDYVDETVS
jgi:hypothetical protein